MTEYGIFSDESADYTSENAVESQFYSREEAEVRLQEMREECGDSDDNCYVHECEEPDDEEDEESTEEEAGEDEE